jgi:hypothetical protein
LLGFVYRISHLKLRTFLAIQPVNYDSNEIFSRSVGEEIRRNLRRFGRTVNWVEEQDLIEPIAQLLRQSKGLQRTKGEEETSKENLQSIHPENLSTSAADNQSFSRPFRSGNL